VKDNLIKYGIMAVIGIFVIICLLIFINSLSCISAPKQIEGELQSCSDAKYIAYAFHRNDKVPETVISEGLKRCGNQQDYVFCKSQVEGIEDVDRRKAEFSSCWDKIQ
jgi:hypothetical protein